MSATCSSFARAALGAAVTFVLLDAVWIVTAAGPLFRSTMGAAMLDVPRAVPAIAFYILYPLGLALLAVCPALRQESFAAALLLGAATGALAYGTFDLTNLALLEAYATHLALIDWAWGTLVSSLAAAGGFLFARRNAAGGVSP